MNIYDLRHDLCERICGADFALVPYEKIKEIIEILVAANAVNVATLPDEILLNDCASEESSEYAV